MDENTIGNQGPSSTLSSLEKELETIKEKAARVYRHKKTQSPITAFKRTPLSGGELNADVSSSFGGRPDKVGTGDHASRGVEDVINQ